MSRSRKRPYTGSKRFDSRCRNHGACPWCRGNRLHKHRKGPTVSDSGNVRGAGSDEAICEHNQRIRAARAANAARWQPPETAPRDGTQFLGDFGWPWPCPAVWHEINGDWVISVLQAGDFHGKPDYYFETDSERLHELRRWLPMPDLPKEGDQ